MNNTKSRIYKYVNERSTTCIVSSNVGLLLLHIGAEEQALEKNTVIQEGETEMQYSSSNFTECFKDKQASSRIECLVCGHLLSEK